MFTGLSAFPLTPGTDAGIDEAAFARLVRRAAEAGVDSIGALGSTGGYAYLSRDERARAADIAVANSGGVPVIVGIGALRTRDVLSAAEDAQRAGVAGVLLAPMTYQPLTDDDVFGLYEEVSANLSVPLCVYDNPGTTRFTFSDELHGRIAELPKVASIKIPGVPSEPDEAAARVARLRDATGGAVTIGVSGDAMAATGLIAGCDAWYSVIAGILPQHCAVITRAALAGDADTARALSRQWQPLWDLFARHGSLRVVSAAAEHLGLAAHPNLPRPIRGLGGESHAEVGDVLARLEIRV
ncbi:dihydrodipicolinate synthase family protein [Saccharopolyspora gloriosae]|uniref:dihydrodipicolinate synthase family protein n=1 Tax=Saccharopolyspora gloriosae TaxID=455344 RepID=UPI001FB5BBA1|nr:dihydrodipicolinate synthase family protein [Saccharopolyspora gloriosae]